MTAPTTEQVREARERLEQDAKTWEGGSPWARAIAADIRTILDALDGKDEPEGGPMPPFETLCAECGREWGEHCGEICPNERTKFRPAPSAPAEPPRYDSLEEMRANHRLVSPPAAPQTEVAPSVTPWGKCNDCGDEIEAEGSFTHCRKCVVKRDAEHAASRLSVSPPKFTQADADLCHNAANTDSIYFHGEGMREALHDIADRISSTLSPAPTPTEAIAWALNPNRRPASVAPSAMLPAQDWSALATLCTAHGNSIRDGKRTHNADEYAQRWYDLAAEIERQVPPATPSALLPTSRPASPAPTAEPPKGVSGHANCACSECHTPTTDTEKK